MDFLSPQVQISSMSYLTASPLTNLSLEPALDASKRTADLSSAAAPVSADIENLA
jgi:hypothetical protein